MKLSMDKIEPTEDMETESSVRKILLALDLEDYGLLEQAASLEKLNKTEILRRGLRRYAKELGLANTPPTV